MELDEPAIVDEVKPGPSTLNTEVSIPAVKIINIAENEVFAGKKSVPPVKVYTGCNIFIEVKEFKKTLYCGLYKQEDGAVRNRFNFPMSHLPKIEEALAVLKDHVRSSDACQQ